MLVHSLGLFCIFLSSGSTCCPLHIVLLMSEHIVSAIKLENSSQNKTHSEMCSVRIYHCSTCDTDTHIILHCRTPSFTLEIKSYMRFTVQLQGFTKPRTFHQRLILHLKTCLLYRKVLTSANISAAHSAT